MLLVHGNPDFSFLYRHQIDDLRTSYRCVAFDMPGFGLSEPVAGFGFAPEEQSSVLQGLIEHLDLRSVWLVVHDWGGPIGLRAAQQLSDRFAGLIVTGTLAWPDYRRRSPWWVRLMMGFLGGNRGRSFTLKNNLILEGPLRSANRSRTLIYVMDTVPVDISESTLKRKQLRPQPGRTRRINHATTVTKPSIG